MSAAHRFMRLFFYGCLVNLFVKKAFYFIYQLGCHINCFINCTHLIVNRHHMNIFAVNTNKCNGINRNTGAASAAKKFLTVFIWKIKKFSGPFFFYFLIKTFSKVKLCAFSC